MARPKVTVAGKISVDQKDVRSLVITRWAPEEPRGGSALRLFQNLHGLARLGPVDVLSIGLKTTENHNGPVRKWIHFDLERVASERPARMRVWTRMWRVRSGAHPGMDAYWHPPAARWLREQLAAHNYDLIVIGEINLCRYLPVAAGGKARVVYDAHNVECVLTGDLDTARFGGGTSWWRRTSRRILGRRMAREERRLVRDVDAIWACSESDAKIFRELFGAGSRAVVVPNCVDVGAYAKTRGVRNTGDWSRLPVSGLYLGSYSYFPNEDAAIRLLRDVLPRMRARDPRSRVVIVGREPTPLMLKFAAEDGGVEITGAVDSVLPYLAAPNILTLPIGLGGGTRLKILEAFAAGTPVVSSTKGMEGIEAIDGVHLMVADDSDRMAALAVDLWLDQRQRREMSDAALRLVAERYSWDYASECIEQSLRDETANQHSMTEQAS